MVKIHILGSGTPTPHSKRYGSAYAIELEDEIVLVDCGPATTWKLCKAGLDPTKVSSLFITHHHSDHVIDTPCLVLTRWDQLMDSSQSIHILGPGPTEVFCDNLFEERGAFAADWTSRIAWPSHTVSLPTTRWLATAAPASGNGKRYTRRVTAGYARHAQPTMESLAYRFDFTGGKCVVFTGDTEICEEILELAKGADMLLCMALDSPRGPDGARGDCMAGCSDSHTAGLMARQAGVRKLVLTHQSGAQDEALSLRDATAEFEGPVVYGQEMEVFELQSSGSRSMHTGIP